MALLNPPEFLPQVARFIYRYLLGKPTRSAPKAELVAALAPPSLLHPAVESADAGSPEVLKTLSLCENLGLVTTADDRVTLSADLPEAARDPRRGDVGFVPLLRRLVLAADQNCSDWGSQEGTRDFTNAVSWYLRLDPSDFPGTWDTAGDRPGAADRQGRDFAGPGPLANTERWRPFARWSGYLGFTWSASLGKGTVVVPDPTGAIRDSIPAVLESGAEIRATDFVDQLAEELPVLDRGVYRRFVEQASIGTVPESSDLLSASLSIALLRLEQEGLLTLIDRADTEKLSLAPTTGRGRTVSHFARPKSGTRKKAGR